MVKIFMLNHNNILGFANYYLKIIFIINIYNKNVRMY